MYPTVFAGDQIDQIAALTIYVRLRIKFTSFVRGEYFFLFIDSSTVATI